MQGSFTILGVASLLVTALSVWADRRQTMRRNIEAVGFMPWTLMTILGTMATLFAFAFALKASGG